MNFLTVQTIRMKSKHKEMKIYGSHVSVNIVNYHYHSHKCLNYSTCSLDI